MSKKGQKGQRSQTGQPSKSKKKSSVARGRADTALASAEASVEVVPTPVRPRIETPIAFESPHVAEPIVAAETEGSIPAVDFDSHFFSTGTHHPRAVADEDEANEERDPRMVLKLSPAAAKRRAQFQRYVKLAVGAASVLCLAALVKVAVARNHEEPIVGRASASMQVAPPPVAIPAETSHTPPRVQPVDEIPPPPPPAETETAPTTPVATAAAVAPEAPVAEPATTAAAAPVATDTAAASDPAATTEPDPKAAAQEKHASQLALERGKAADAIEAGERSVALDPSDAEAWLILGAAYQEKGDLANARRSFKSCLTEGKRGPKWECAQFPH